MPLGRVPIYGPTRGVAVDETTQTVSASSPTFGHSNSSNGMDRSTLPCDRIPVCTTWGRMPPGRGGCWQFWSILASFGHLLVGDLEEARLRLEVPQPGTGGLDVDRLLALAVAFGPQVPLLKRRLRWGPARPFSPP
eukprot:7237972-Pyramimonas_sp.AAC.2